MNYYCADMVIEHKQEIANEISKTKNDDLNYTKLLIILSNYISSIDFDTNQITIESFYSGVFIYIISKSKRCFQIIMNGGNCPNCDTILMIQSMSDSIYPTPEQINEYMNLCLTLAMNIRQII